MQDLNEILEIIISPKLPSWVVAIKMFLIIFSFLLLAGIVYFAIFTDYFYYRFFESMEDWYEFRARQKKKKKKFRTKNLEKNVSKKEKGGAVGIFPWERIFARIEKGGEMGPRLGLIDADKLVNQKLEELGYEGRDLKEKIKNLDKNTLPNLEELKNARNLLEEILSEKKKAEKDEIEKAVKIYKRVYDHLSGKFVK